MGRTSRGRTIVDIDLRCGLVVQELTCRERWSEGDGRSAVADVLSQTTVTIKQSRVPWDDIPWCPDLRFVSTPVRKLLGFCEDQVVWVPTPVVSATTHPADTQAYFPLLPVHVFSCGMQSPVPTERSGRVPFELDVNRVPPDIHIFCAVEWPGRILVSDRVKDAIVQSRVKRAYFSEPAEKIPLW